MLKMTFFKLNSAVYIPNFSYNLIIKFLFLKCFWEISYFDVQSFRLFRGKTCGILLPFLWLKIKGADCFNANAAGNTKIKKEENNLF